VDTASGGIGRRAFLGAGITAGVALAGRADPLTWAAATARTERWVEASIPELQALMARRQLTSRELTLGYPRRMHH
jgi:hypothetical protein